MPQINPLTRLTRARIALLTLAALFVYILAGSMPVAQAAPAKARFANVIVQYGDKHVVNRPITFDVKKITGLEALQLTGLQVISIDTQFGPAVCSIGGIGMPAENCFGDPEGRYWGYNYWDGSAWVGYEVGAGESKVKDGAIQGWRWGQFGDPVYPANPVLAGQQALDWLAGQQSETDGGYGGPGPTVDVELAVGANNLLAKDWKRTSSSPSLFNYFKQKGKKFSKSNASTAGKLALALTAAKGCFPEGTRLPADYYDSNTGIYMTGAGPQSLAMLGTIAADQAVPAAAVTYLLGLQQANGGFEWSPTWGTDTNATALAIQALLGAGELPASEAIVEAVGYLDAAQNADGGFPYAPGGDSDANSTAWAVQAIIAAGQDPFSPDWTGQTNPLGYLQTLQLPDGSLEWQAGGGTNLFATAQAIPALLGTPFPSRVAAPKTCK